MKERILRQTQRLIVIDDIDHCWCSKHQEYFPCTEFNTQKNSSNGYQSCCKVCNKKYQAEQIPVDDIEDFIIRQSKIMLSNLGYDVESEVPVSEQFRKKHGLSQK